MVKAPDLVSFFLMVLQSLSRRNFWIYQLQTNFYKIRGIIKHTPLTLIPNHFQMQKIYDINISRSSFNNFSIFKLNAHFSLQSCIFSTNWHRGNTWLYIEILWKSFPNNFKTFLVKKLFSPSIGRNYLVYLYPLTISVNKSNLF